MKKHKFILALTVLMVVIFSILAKAQVVVPSIPIPKLPPTPTPTPKEPFPPLIPTHTSKSLSPPFVPPLPTPSTSSAPFFPSPPSQPLPTPTTPPLPLTTPTAPATPTTPTTPSTPSGATLSTQSPISTDPPSCNTSNDCPDPKKLFCNYSGKCQYKGQTGDKCDNDNNEQCVDQLICSKNVCGYEDLSPNKGNHSNYNIKNVAMTGGIIVGISAISGLIFLVSRYLKNRKERKNLEITSNIYSTDDEMTEPDPSYPFSESTNSFSDKTMPHSHDPYINRYDHIPPGGFVGPRSGFHNYYNNEYNDGMGGATRTMDPRNLQQTRGNVMMAPPPQQNYNWNYGVPQQLVMNQGGLYPIPLERNYGVPMTNNIDDNSNSFPREDDKSKYNRERRDSNTLSGGKAKSKLPTSEHENNNSSNRSNRMYNVSIYDAYTRDSVLSERRQNSKNDKNKSNTHRTYDQNNRQ